MINKSIFILFLFAFISSKGISCTNLLIGKNASEDGSTMISYSADSYQSFGFLYHSEGKKHKVGEILKIYDWDSGKYLGDIPQVSQTYNVVGNINEYMLTIAESTFEAREELKNPEGKIDYGSLIYITLQRAKTAREAIKIMTDLVEKYGYCSDGESFSIGDPDEIWILEMVGKGKGVNGAIWAAVRIPDNAVSAHANFSRIHKIPKNDENYMYSDDVISFAKQKGYFKGDDKDFNFSKAYAINDFGAFRYCEARVWSFFSKVSNDMEKYTDYAIGSNLNNQMPLYVIPNKKISVSDVQGYMRDHFEGTPIDPTKDPGAGSYESPYRLSPLEWDYKGQKYCFERPISTQQTAFVFVSQMRGWLPREVGGIIWFGVDDASMTIFYPIYCSITKVPKYFSENTADLVTFSWESAFWIHNWVSNLVYGGRYNYMIKDIKKVQKEIENQLLVDQNNVDQEYVKLLKISRNKALNYINKHSSQMVEKGEEKWKKLGEFLLVKYMDGVIKKEKDGHFLKDENNKVLYPDRPEIPEEQKKEIIEKTGNKNKVLF